MVALYYGNTKKKASGSALRNIIIWFIFIPRSSVHLWLWWIEDSLTLYLLHISTNRPSDFGLLFNCRVCKIPEIGHWRSKRWMGLVTLLWLPLVYSHGYILRPHHPASPLSVCVLREPMDDCCYCSVVMLCLSQWDPTDCCTPGFHVVHHLLEIVQTHVHWVGDSIQTSHPVIPFSCLLPFPASGSFPISQFFASGSQNIGASASASALLMNIQGWFPLGFTGLVSLLSGRLSRVFSGTTVRKNGN